MDDSGAGMMSLLGLTFDFVHPKITAIQRNVDTFTH